MGVSRRLRALWGQRVERDVAARVHGITDLETWVDHVRCSPNYARKYRLDACDHTGRSLPESGGPAFGEG